MNNEPLLTPHSSQPALSASLVCPPSCLLRLRPGCSCPAPITCPDSVCLTCHTPAMHLASGAGHCASDFVFTALCAGCCVASSICLAVCVWFCVPSRVISVMHLTQCRMSRVCVWRVCSAFCCWCVCMPGIVYSVLCAMCGVPGVMLAESVTGGVCSFMCPAL